MINTATRLSNRRTDIPVRFPFSPILRTQFLTAALILFALATADAQFRGMQRYRDRDLSDLPTWEIPAGFERDTFTFVRLRADDHRRWRIDYPDSDHNFSYRLQEMTSLLVNPRPVILSITDPNLKNYPFAYIVEPGDLYLNSQEVAALRDYLLNGGFLMFDDFWGEEEWENLEIQLKRVFPDRRIEDLELDHPIFHSVFDIAEKPQVPSIGSWRGLPPGVTWERSDAQDVHFRAIYDDKGRMMVLICHNTDLGDGWEREGEDPEYFKEFSEKKAYPMGINIIFYMMTH
jgi:hypothetical protein